MAFERAKQEIAELRARAQADEIEVAYLDEAGFAQIHPNRSAWTPVGEQHCIEAIRGKRLNVVAALLSSGKVFSAKLWCAFKAPLFASFVGLLKEQVTKPLTVILDNASVQQVARDCAANGSATPPRCDAVLSPAVQSGIEPHREALASGQAHLDGAQAPQRPDAGK